MIKRISNEFSFHEILYIFKYTKRTVMYFPDGTGTLFYEFTRILWRLQQHAMATDSHLFWMFEHVASMTAEHKKIMSKYLKVSCLCFSPYACMGGGHHMSGIYSGLYVSHCMCTVIPATLSRKCKQ